MKLWVAEALSKHRRFARRCAATCKPISKACAHAGQTSRRRQTRALPDFVHYKAVEYDGDDDDAHACVCKRGALCCAHDAVRKIMKKFAHHFLPRKQSTHTAHSTTSHARVFEGVVPAAYSAEHASLSRCGAWSVASSNVYALAERATASATKVACKILCMKVRVRARVSALCVIQARRRRGLCGAA